MRKRRSPRKGATKAPEVKRLSVSHEQLKAIVAQVKEGKPLSEEEFETLDGAVDTLALLTQELEHQGASIRRLRRLIFGPSTERTRDLFPNDTKDQPQGQPEKPLSQPEELQNAAQQAVTKEQKQVSSPSSAGEQEPPQSPDEPESKRKPKGHGRNGAKDYTGAQRVHTPHQSLEVKQCCPECEKGKLYELREPQVLVRVQGVAPLSATLFEQQRLRCNLCGEVFTAQAPEGVGKDKYDESAAAMIGLLKYGCGVPFYRLSRLEKAIGIPLPPSTQWDVVDPAATKLRPVYVELISQAAQWELFHNDDTKARILELYPSKEQREEPEEPETDEEPKRSGMYTTGVVSVGQDHRVALYFTGREHAGENLERVLKERSRELPVPIQMSDGLSANTKGDCETIEAECNCHARRYFVEVVDSYPDEVKHVLSIYKQVYKNDAWTKEQGLSAKERLAYHQQHSAKPMAELLSWCEEQFAERKVEPNSSLGQAIRYLTKHWDKLTRFLHVEGVPLDNNLVERALKRAILHRKNSLFFKTKHGAEVGDIFLSLAHTCELENVNPFDYLVAVLKHHEAAAVEPELWLPWTYQSTLLQLE